MTELCFADDAAIVAPTKDSIARATAELDRVVKACGLTIRVPKTKLLVAGTNIPQADLDSVCTGESTIETVSSFWNPGCVMDCHGSMNAELTARVA